MRNTDGRAHGAGDGLGGNDRANDLPVRPTVSGLDCQPARITFARSRVRLCITRGPCGARPHGVAWRGLGPARNVGIRRSAPTKAHCAADWFVSRPGARGESSLSTRPDRRGRSRVNGRFRPARGRAARATKPEAAPRPSCPLSCSCHIAQAGYRAQNVLLCGGRRKIRPALFQTIGCRPPPNGANDCRGPLSNLQLSDRGTRRP